VIRPIDPPIPRGTVSSLVFVPRDPPPESGPGHFTLSLCLERAPSCRSEADGAVLPRIADFQEIAIGPSRSE